MTAAERLLIQEVALTGPRLRAASRATALCAAVVAGVAGCQSHPSSRPTGGRASASRVRLTVSKPVIPPITTPAAAGRSTCTLRQVSLTYRNGGMGTGNNFGVIVLVNVGAVACEVDDLRLTVTPIDEAGRVIATERGWVNTATASQVALSAHGGPPRGEQLPRAGDQWADIMLGGDGRDDPLAPNGLCASRHEVAPYAWRVTGSFSATVRNLDSYIVAHPSRGTSPSLYACSDPYLNLLNVDIGRQP